MHFKEQLLKIWEMFVSASYLPIPSWLTLLCGIWCHDDTWNIEDWTEDQILVLLSDLLDNFQA